jgi:hypothetical protein
MFKYIYYKIYKIVKITEKSWSKNLEMPHWVALFILSIFLFLNFITILFCYTDYTGKVVDLNLYLIVFLGLGVYLLNYLLFIHKQAYIKIEKRFDKDASAIKVVKSIFFWFYIILSIWMLNTIVL